MVDSNQMRDLDLIGQIRSGDEEAREKLIIKYIPMVKYVIRSYYSSFLDFEDLLQEGLIGLLSAVEEYRPDQYAVKFSSFAYICIIRRIYNVIKQTTGNKHRLLNEATSLQAPVGLDENRMLGDLIADQEPRFDPANVFEEKYVQSALSQILKNHLSLLEYAVINRLLQGYTAYEIRKEMGIGAKVVDNARTRVKTKLKRLVQEHGSLLNPQVPTNVRKRKDLYFDVSGR